MKTFREPLNYASKMLFLFISLVHQFLCSFVLPPKISRKTEQGQFTCLHIAGNLPSAGAGMVGDASFGVAVFPCRGK